MVRPNRTEILKHLTRRKTKRVNDLIIKIEMVMGSLERCKQSLQERGIPENSLGVLQYQATELDRLCGEIDALDEAIEFVSKGE